MDLSISTRTLDMHARKHTRPTASSANKLRGNIFLSADDALAALRCLNPPRTCTCSRGVFRKSRKSIIPNQRTSILLRLDLDTQLAHTIQYQPARANDRGVLHIQVWLARCQLLDCNHMSCFDRSQEIAVAKTSVYNLRRYLKQ